jgi:alpha-1,6-mannosyltransferase
VPKRPWLTFLIGGILEVLWLSIYRLAPLRENTVPFLALILTIFCGCCLAFAFLELSGRRQVYVVLGFALLFRLTVLPAEPGESEDVYRYLWDGRLAASGVDPMRYPPEAPELSGFRDSKIYPMLNSKPYVTAYPPLSQALFRFAYGLFGDAVIPMKAVFFIFEFLALLVAWRLLVEFRQPLEPLLLMAWNPFFIFEFSHSGHSDSAMIFLALLSVLLLYRSRRVMSLVSYAGAVLSKLHPALWFPLYARRAGLPACLAGIGAGLAMSALYFTPAGLLRYITSLRLYFKLFEFNASIHYLLRYVGNEFFGQSWDQTTGLYLGAALAIISALIWLLFPVRDAASLLHAAFWISVVDLCLATTVHPWYISWAAFALPVFPYAFMLYWTGASFLSYFAYQYRPVYEPTWVLLVEYLPMYLLMAWEISRKGPLLTGLPRRRHS